MPGPANPALSADDVRKVALLARLDLTPEQIEEHRVHLGAILAYVERLRELDTAGVEPLANLSTETNRLRDDTPSESMPRDLFLANAPATHGPFLKVPRVLGDDGSS